MTNLTTEEQARIQADIDVIPLIKEAEHSVEQVTTAINDHEALCSHVMELCIAIITTLEEREAAGQLDETSRELQELENQVKFSQTILDEALEAQDKCRIALMENRKLCSVK